MSIGQCVTIVEKGVYTDINGYDWSRIYLADGRQGYIVSTYLEEVSSSDYEILQVVTSSGLNVRESPGTDQKILTTLSKGDTLTRIASAVSTKNGYTWDQIVTSDGVEGYIARGDSDGDYVKVVSSSSTSSTSSSSTSTTTTISGTGFKTSGTYIVCNPSITVSNITSVSSSAVIKDSNGNTITSSTTSLGTGYTIKVNGKTYTVKKLGDVNGDGKISSADYVRIKNYLLNKSTLTTVQELAADANGDGTVSSADYVRIKNYLLGTAKISI